MAAPALDAMNASNTLFRNIYIKLHLQDGRLTNSDNLEWYNVSNHSEEDMKVRVPLQLLIAMQRDDLEHPFGMFIYIRKAPT